MKSNTYKKIISLFIVILVIYWLPFVIISLRYRSSIFDSIDHLPSSDAVIVFGTLVGKSGSVSPLLKERLDAGGQILKAEKAKYVVVSNTELAAKVMADYLRVLGIANNLIEVDSQAEKTPDTCVFKKRKYPENRNLIFVSQSFHLPRLLYQCSQLSVKGVAFPAESLDIIDRAEYPFLTKLKVRTIRYIREAGLTWLAVLGIY